MTTPGVDAVVVKANALVTGGQLEGHILAQADGKAKVHGEGGVGVVAASAVLPVGDTVAGEQAADAGADEEGGLVGVDRVVADQRVGAKGPGVIGLAVAAGHGVESVGHRTATVDLAHVKRIGQGFQAEGQTVHDEIAAA